ncbi:hypothetical protein HRbin10_00670 [bacterium HR10]|nr:hypothetical protein HRbin10_00670 [bacterium HR10]
MKQDIRVQTQKVGLSYSFSRHPKRVDVIRLGVERVVDEPERKRVTLTNLHQLRRHVIGQIPGDDDRLVEMTRGESFQLMFEERLSAHLEQTLRSLARKRI